MTAPPTVNYASPTDEAAGRPRPLPQWAVVVGYVWIVSEAFPLMWNLHLRWRVAGGWYVIGRKLQMTVPAFYSICDDLILLALVLLAAVLPFRHWARAPLLALLCLAMAQWAMLLTGVQLVPNPHLATLMAAQFCVVPLALYSMCGDRTPQRWRRTYWLTLASIAIWCVVLAAEPRWWRLLLGTGNLVGNSTSASSEQNEIVFISLFVWSVLLAVTAAAALLVVIACRPRRLSTLLAALVISIGSGVTLSGWRSLEALERTSGFALTIDGLTVWMLIPALHALSLMNWPLVLAMLHRRAFRTPT